MSVSMMKRVAEAARTLFAVSRLAKKTANDTDRLSKYLARHRLSFSSMVH